MIVYRVENEEGKGPYRDRSPSEFRDDMVDRHSCCPDHPLPEDDGLLAIHKLGLEISYGFSSLESLHEWFSEYELEMLYNEGYVIQTYEASEVHKGEHQVVFAKQTAVYVGEYDEPKRRKTHQVSMC